MRNDFLTEGGNNMRKNNMGVSRRTFLVSASGFLAGSSILGVFPVFSGREVSQQLKKELSADELKWVKQSSMAREFKDYFHKGYSCAESLLMVSLRYLGKPEELVWVAAGFGGGLGQKDLCGFLTAGVMGIGLAAGSLEMDKKEAKPWCTSVVNQYWQWWGKLAPLHCAEIRPPGSSSKICMRFGHLASAKVEELIKTAQKS